MLRLQVTLQVAWSAGFMSQQDDPPRSPAAAVGGCRFPLAVGHMLQLLATVSLQKLPGGRWLSPERGIQGKGRGHGESHSLLVFLLVVVFVGGFA